MREVAEHPENPMARTAAESHITNLKYHIGTTFLLPLTSGRANAELGNEEVFNVMTFIEAVPAFSRYPSDTASLEAELDQLENQHD